MDEEGGVLGKLPRSRPGTRSRKRAAGRPRQASRPPEASQPAATDTAPRDAKPARAADADPVGDAVRLALKAPVLGARVGAGITRELLRRLPRP
ncbi:MAG: hypothetical protein ABR581_06865 [Thermoleophilaceae bacterium]